METKQISNVFNRDCMEAMAEFPDKYFDLAIVDPPYGISVNMNAGRKLDTKSKKRAALPKDYQLQFDRLQIEYDRMIEYNSNPISDETKIDWFYYINFAGTLQDLEHMKSLKKLSSVLF